MKLPDFIEFEPFNGIRERMGADTLGDFVFFDPHLNLTGHERLSLEREGLEVDDEHFRVGGDFTLIYKDSRVLLFLDECSTTTVTATSTETIGSQKRPYHLASCAEVEAILKCGLKGSRWLARTHLRSVEQEHCEVCTGCLQRIQYQNFDKHRHRHRGYSDRVQQDFDLSDFFSRYPMYPVGPETSIPIF
ncbi:MAG: hypothetical protein ACRBBW_17900 [Cellvibrionaceae bacterium]